MNAITKTITGFTLCLFVGSIFSSCKADQEIVQKPVEETYLQEAKTTLRDVVVLNATAMMGTVNKTLLKEGCPLKYYMEWRSENELNIQIREFSVGKMPVTIWFSINCKFMKLNTWEKEEYPEAGWIKFEGSGGIVNFTGKGEGYEDGQGGGGTVIGYFNAQTHEIEFVTNFNTMNMTSDVYRQKIDPTRINRYDAEFAQYEKDLEKYKKEHGIV